MGRSWAGRVSDPGIGTFRKLVFLGWRCVLSGVVLEPDTVLPSICGVLLSKWVFGLCTCLYMHTCAQAPLPLGTALCLPAGPGNLLPAFALNRLRKVDLDLDVCCVLGGGGYEKSLSKKRDSSDRMNPSQCIPTTIPTFVVSMDVAGTERKTQRYSLDPGHGLRVFGKCLQHLAWLLLHSLWWPLDMLSSLSPHSVPRQSRLGWLADLKLQRPIFLFVVVVGEALKFMNVVFYVYFYQKPLLRKMLSLRKSPFLVLQDHFRCISIILTWMAE